MYDTLHQVSGVTPADDDGNGKRAKKQATKFDSMPLAPAAEQGKVIFLGDEQPPAPDPAAKRAAHLLQRAINDGRDDLYDQFRQAVEQRPLTELRDLLELAPAACADSARRGRAGR